jgi:hypothetical protein
LIERAGRVRDLLADTGDAADRLPRSLREVGAIPVIPGRPQPQARHSLRPAAIPRPPFHRKPLLPPEGLSPLATRYDMLAANFLSAAHLAAAIAFRP